MNKFEWTAEKDALLRSMRSKSQSVKSIAERLGCSEATVYNRMYKIGLLEKPGGKKAVKVPKMETPERPLVKADVVNHPSHYTSGSIECIDAIKAAVPDFESYCTGNIIKYVWRYRQKNGAEDLRKAEWYLSKLISEVES